MSLVQEAGRHVPDDLLAMPDAERYELVDGVLVEKEMGAHASWVATRLSRFLGVWAEEQGLGWVFGGETGYQCFGVDALKVRRPDVSFIRRGRLPGNRVPDGHILVPPDIAVEVISPNDRFSEVEAKVSEYLEVGVPLIWEVDPETRTVRVYQSGGPILRLTAADELTGGDVLSGFRCRVAELFELPE